MWLISDSVARELRAASAKLVFRGEDRARFTEAYSAVQGDKSAARGRR